MGTDPVIVFETYFWDTLCDHANMSQVVNFKFDDHPAMSASITQFTVSNSTSNTASNLINRR